MFNLRQGQPKARSLAHNLYLQLAWIGSAVIFSTVLILLVFSWRSVALVSDSLMRLDAASLANRLLEQPDMTLPRGETYSAYLKYQDIPLAVRQLFTEKPQANGDILEATQIQAGSTQYLYLLHYRQQGLQETSSADNALFLISKHSESEITAVVNIVLSEIIKQALWLVIIVLVAVLLLTFWVLRNTTRPIKLLAQWADSMASEDTTQRQAVRLNNRPFAIVELNDIADTLQNSVAALEAFNRREKAFLQQASHEFRTPLAIIQASVDTLELIESKQASKDQCSASSALRKKSLGRAQRASENLRILSASLLWLARKSKQPIATEKLELLSFCNETIAHHEHLLVNNHTKIQVTTDPVHSFINIEIAKGLFGIVLVNILRNALQHSRGPFITVLISHDQIVVENSIEPSSPILANQQTESTMTYLPEQSFGLGIELVKRICTVQNWQFNQIFTTLDGTHNQAKSQVVFNWERAS
ncbi:MAG: HAMP domain-containing sensor histidine kinase [Oceanospirillaceae bacterium]